MTFEEFMAANRPGTRQELTYREVWDAALAAEREACARLVEEALVPQDCDTDDMKQLAEDIRARSTP